ncbi:hypothetical protein MASR2M52_19050 [Pedobacter sp.]
MYVLKYLYTLSILVLALTEVVKVTKPICSVKIHFLLSGVKCTSTNLICQGFVKNIFYGI